eukprot:CAMPEP_0198145832 /NCGR_PEP_ID=MMETSP1443-20131203/25626_1 /TAXON_ID=186043 /ORGANISM="Entomoneis sp., Strain CCMP2396" /LENGTH=290 /DNA_ID=CAMNT_0043809571 /DNA_START=34 /DNA_END=906 /DNA_ORIENTATION=-
MERRSKATDELLPQHNADVVDDYDSKKKNSISMRLKVQTFRVVAVVLFCSIFLAGRGYRRRKRSMRIQKEQQKAAEAKQVKETSKDQAGRGKATRGHHRQKQLMRIQKEQEREAEAKQVKETAKARAEKISAIDYVSDSMGAAVESAGEWANEQAEQYVGKEIAQSVGGVMDQGLDQVGEWADQGLKYASDTMEEVDAILNNPDAEGLFSDEETQKDSAEDQGGSASKTDDSEAAKPQAPGGEGSKPAETAADKADSAKVTPADTPAAKAQAAETPVAAVAVAAKASTAR